LPGKQAFQNQVAQTFDTMDAANTWEITHCRWKINSGTLYTGELPDFGGLDQLASRSLGHTLTPLAVLFAAGASPPARRYVQTALRHYIIAKQLNDDMHDWKEDLAAGRITYVVSRILRQLELASGQHQLPKILPVAERMFWYQVLPSLCDDITYQITQSRNALAKSKLLQPDNIIEKLLKRIEHSNEETTNATAQVKTFLRVYSDTGNT